MKLNLATLPTTEVFGIYGAGEDEMPTRARFLAPDAVEGFRQVQKALGMRIRISDMFRSADSSLAAVRAGRGAQMPGYSAHSYGLAIDVDLTWMLKKSGGGFATKAAMDAFFESYNWWCHRVDHKLDHEAWHLNWDIKEFLQPEDTTRGPALERKLQSLYSSQFVLTLVESQEKLKGLRFYSGAVDGKLGPLTREAVEAFQRAWGVSEHRVGKREVGTLGIMTQRILAYVTAKQQIVEANV